MTTPTATAPRLTLVVIVRDEAADLRRLLTWHSPLYDEAIVVDTGSRDDSVAVAKELGARVTHFRWCDDFSAARNHGLAQARGDWVLVLDCDELIAAADFQAVRDLCGGEGTGWYFEQWNYCEQQSYQDWLPLPSRGPLTPATVTGYIANTTCRLFPRHPEVLYQGVVHELPDATLAAAGIRLKKTPLVIHHYGYLEAANTLEQKNLLYAKLLRKKLQENQEDPKVRFEMAVQLVNEGCPDLAKRMLQRTVLENPHHQETQRARLLLGRLLLAAGESAAAVRHLEYAVRQWPALRTGWVDTARTHVQLGHRQRAAQYIAKGRYLFPLDPTLQHLEAKLSRQLAENE